MDNLIFNKILNRESITKEIVSFLTNFEKNKQDLSITRGIYIYGNSGIGKTYFIQKLLTSINYDIIGYNSSNIRNKSAIELITKNNISDTNVFSMLTGQQKKMVILMDEIDSMKNNDKGGLGYLIKLIRPKKTKKQQKEQISQLPIICIGNNTEERKIKELMNVCLTIHFKDPTEKQINDIVVYLMPKLSDKLKLDSIDYIDKDFRKLEHLYDIYKYDELDHYEETLNILRKKKYNQNIKLITKNLLLDNLDNYQLNFKNVINDTDKTIVALLWHENIIDLLDNKQPEKSIKIYNKILSNICYADYIDRIIFQKQLWDLNELSFLIKTIYNNYILQTNYTTLNKDIDIRFTKILTKYSSEFNNYTFFQNLCSNLHRSKKELLLMFNHIKDKDEEEISEFYDMLERNNITKLEYNRIIKYINLITD